jgi:hypothetical protein
MSKIILNANNSFVTFYNLVNNQGSDYFITDTECGIQKDFCLPIFDEKDLAFQVNIASPEVLTSSNIVVNKVANGTAGQVFGMTVVVTANGMYGGSVPIYNIYIDFIGSNLTQGLDDGDCIQLSLVLGIDEQLLYMVSNQCFKKISDKCLTTRMVYANNDAAFGFLYRAYGTFPFIAITSNKIRLPMYLKEPNVNSNKNVYIRSDGSRKLLSARLSKSYKGFIDSVTEEVHQKLVVALNHDGVFLHPEDYPTINGMQVTFEDEYNNEFPSIMQNVNVWPADFTIFETPFNNFNSNCV